MPIGRTRYWETIPRSKERAEEIRAFRRQAMSRTLRHEIPLTNATQDRISVARKQLGAFFQSAARERSGITPVRAPDDRAPVTTLELPQHRAEGPGAISPAQRRELSLFSGVQRELDAALERENMTVRQFLELDEADRARFLFPDEQPILAAQRLREAITEATRNAPAILETPSGTKVEVPGEPGPLGALRAADAVSSQIARQTTGQIAAAGQIVNDLRRLKAPSRQELAALGGTFTTASAKAAEAEFERLPEGGPTVPLFGKLSAGTVGETTLRPENLLFETRAAKGIVRVGFEPIGQAIGRNLGRARELLGSTVFKPAPEAIVYADSAVRPPKPTDPMSTGVRDVQRQLAADIEFEPVMGLLDEAVVAPSPLPIDAQIAAVKTQLRQAEISPVLGTIEGGGQRAGRSSFDVQAEITRLTQRRTELRATAADSSVSAVGRRRAATDADGVASQLQRLRRELRPEVVQGVGPGGPTGAATTGRIQQLQAELRRLELQRRKGAQPLLGTITGEPVTTADRVALQKKLLRELEEGILPRATKRADDVAQRARIEDDPMVWAQDNFYANAVVERLSAKFGPIDQEIARRTTETGELAIKIPNWLQAKIKPVYQMLNRRMFHDPRLQSSTIRYASDKEAGLVWAKSVSAQIKQESLRLFGPTIRDNKLGVGRLPTAGKDVLLGRTAADDRLLTTSIKYVGPKTSEGLNREVVGTLPDIIEHREWYSGLTPEQTGFLDDIQSFLREELKFMEKMGAKVTDGDVEEYVAHIWDLPDRASVPRQIVGAHQQMQSPRIFTDIRQGYAAGFKARSLDLGELMEVRLAQSGKIRADGRFIDEIKQIGTKAKFGESVPTGLRRVKHPRLAGLAYEDELARAIDQTLTPEGRGAVTSVIAAPFDVARAILLNLDGSAMIGIQGVARFIDSPVGYAKDVGTAVRFMMTKRGWQRELAMNSDRYIQAATDGVRLFNNITELGATRGILKSRAFGPLMWFNDVQFQRAASYYKVRSYEANRAFLERVAAGKVEGKLLPSGLRENLKKRGPGQLAADHVNNVYGGLDYSKIGAPLAQQEIERFFLLAPGFFRARMGLMIQAMKVGSPEGILADRYILESLGYAFGISAAASLAAGEEPNLTDPSRSDWLTIKTPAGDINWLGGLRTQYRTIVDVAVKLKQGKLDEAQWRLLRFGEAKVSIPLGLTKELTINEDFLGRPIVTKDGFVGKWEQRLQHVGQSTLPISAQAGLEGFVGGARAEPGAFVEFLGVGFIPKTLTARLNDEARKRFGRPYSELGRAEQQELRGDPSLAPEIEEFERERERKIRAGKADLQEQVGFALQDSRQQYDNAIVAIEGLPPNEWRLQYRQIRDDYGANVGRLQRSPTFGRVFEKWNQGEPKTERQGIFRRWIEVFDMSRDPITGIVDGDSLSDRLDRLEASITSQQLSDLQEDLGAKDPEAPTLQEWRRDVQRLSDYWDVTDDAMMELRRAGEIPIGVGSPAEFKQALVSELVQEELRRNPSADPLRAQAIASGIVGRQRRVKLVDQFVTARRDVYLNRNPDVFRLLVKWGYREATASNLDLITAGASQ